MAVAAASSSTSSLLPQMQLTQAQRAADRAEQNARSLRARAQQAQRAANQEQENARNLQVQASQAQQVASSAKQGLITIKSLRQLQSGFDDIHQQISQVTSKAPADPATPAVVNSEGQTTGTVVNTTA